MNFKEAMIIKTNSDLQTGRAKRIRESMKRLHGDIVLVPYGVTDLFITIEREELIVLLQQSEDGYNPIDLDVVRGFDSVAECWEYADIVIKEAGLPRDSCDADVWDAVVNE